MRKLSIIFAFLLSYMGGVNSAWAQVTEGFETGTDGNAIAVNSDNMGLSNGWFIIGTGNYNGIATGTAKYLRLYNGTSYAHGGSYSITSVGSNTYSWIVSSVEVSGEVKFWAKRSGTDGTVKVGTTSDTTGSITAIYTAAKSNDLTDKEYHEVTVNVGDDPVYVAFMPSEVYIDDVTYTVYEEVAGPRLAVKDGITKLTSPYSFDFGLATPGTTKTFTLSNPGTEDLNVSVSETGIFGATLSASTITAGGEATLTLTMPETTSNSTVTITPEAEGINPFVIEVCGTVRDANKLYESGFTSLPEDWTTTGTWYYSAANGAYTTAWYLNSNARLITPQLNISESETFIVEAKGYSTSNTSYQHIQMQYSADGTNWINFGNEPSLNPSEWNTFSFTGVPAGKYYIAINASQADIRMFYGGSLPVEPKLSFTASDYSFGMISEATTTENYVVENKGLAELTGLTVTSDNNNFVVTVADNTTTIGAKSQATFTVTMKADVKGVQSGKISVKADGFDAIEFNVSGYVLDTDVIIVDFADNRVPEGWTNNGFTVSNNELSTTYYTRTLTSPAITVSDGQKLIVYAKGGSTYGARLTVKVSTDNGNSFTTAHEFTTELRNNTSDYVILEVNDIVGGNYILQFEGYYVTINTINGYNYNLDAPALTVDPMTAADFGKVNAQPEAKTYTVTNSGTGTLNVEISSDNEAFTVSKATMQLTEGQSETFDIALVFDENYGEKSAVITIHPTNDGLTDVTINATATTKDPNVWEEDFENGIPDTWTNNGWKVDRKWNEDSNVKHAYSGLYDTNTLTTPRLQAVKDQILTFEVIDAESNYPLTIEYANTLNGEYTKYATITESGTTSFVAPETGFYYLRFSGRYIYLDNFSGFKLAVPEAMTINETENYDATLNGVYTVTMNRTFAEGWNMVVVPFDVTTEMMSKFGDDAKFFEFKDYTDNQLNFRKVTSLTAGVPYIAYTPAITEPTIWKDIEVKDVSNVENPSSNGASYVPVYENGFSVAGKYVLTKKGAITTGNDGATIKALRGYFIVPEGVKPAIGIDENGVATTISAAELLNNQTGDIYDLSGRKVLNAQKGIYIQNGKKVVIK